MNGIIAGIAAKIGPFLATGAGKLLLTQAGATAIIAIILRFVPNEKLDTICFNIGKGLSAFGDMKFGKVFWEPMENFFQNSIGVCMRAFFRGLDSDDGQVASDITAAITVPPDPPVDIVIGEQKK